jgi:hypothetical protein
VVRRVAHHDQNPADWRNMNDYANTLQPTCNQLATDCINRQAAIDALDKRFDSIPLEQTAEILQLRKDLRELPSAQPYTDEEIQKMQDIEQAQFDKIRELAYQDGKADAMAEIIRCRDCCYWIPGLITDNDCFIPPKCGKYQSGKYQQMVGHSADDYCSYAERREVSK